MIGDCDGADGIQERGQWRRGVFREVCIRHESASSAHAMSQIHCRTMKEF